MPPRVLLSSAFKPFGVNNNYGRVESKIELYHNQLTKAQGIFSMRAFMNSFGLHAIANNIEARATVLDFPTLERFKREVKKGYDVVGIGAILPNFQKVKRMVEETRRLSPGSKIVLGGFCATVPDLEKMMDVDYVCVGEGISFMRDLLGEPPEFEFKNPNVYAESKQILGVPIHGVRNPHIVVGLGCSYGCDFCSPSHFFGRRHLKFFKTGDDLFEEMLRVEKVYKSNLIAFIGDDNFLLDLERAEQLRKRVVQSGKVFNLFLFGSADRVMKFTPEKLAEMGAGTIWIGREGKFSSYGKNSKIDIPPLVDELRSYGIKTILSSILLLDSHDKDNVMEDVEDHLKARPAFSQFSHYSPLPGTPLYERLAEDKRILTAIPFEEWHAFKQPWFIHPEFNLKEAERLQEEAYLMDFHKLGPSLMRFIQTDLEGYLNLKHSEKPILRKRARFFAEQAPKYRILLSAMLHLAPTEEMREMIRDVLDKVEKEFGKTGPLEKTAAAGVALFGKAREFRVSKWGDAMQPATLVVEYNGNKARK